MFLMSEVEGYTDAQPFTRGEGGSTMWYCPSTPPTKCSGVVKQGLSLARGGTGVPRSYETPPSWDPTVGLYLGS